MIKKIFGNLSEKFRNENALSDITWVLCETSENFRKLFLKFFFPTEDFNNIQDFQREYPQKNSRPDFYIKNGEKIYLIEVKINDINHHFEQYKEEFKIEKDQLGYIANYPISKEGFNTKTWESFYDDLQKSITDEKNGLGKEESDLIKGYLAYIKNVCSIVKITNTMNLNNLQTVYDFNETLKKVTDFKTEDFRVENRKLDIQHYRTGYYLGVFDLKSEKKDISIWVGAYFDSNDKYQLCIVVEESHPLSKIIISKELLKDRIITDDGCIFIAPKEREVDGKNVAGKDYFNGLDSPKEQQDFLKEFITEVVMWYVN